MADLCSEYPAITTEKPMHVSRDVRENSQSV